MIGRLKGELLPAGSDTVIVQVQGVGYEVVVPRSALADLPEPGAQATLHIHTHVREDEITLYGFVRPSDRDLFRRLIRVSGIGPKIALAVLSCLPGPRLVHAISQGRTSALLAVPGIGRKTAERIVLELKDKLAELEGLCRTDSGPVAGIEPDDLGLALRNLGFKQASVDKVLQKMRESGPSDAPFEEILRQALSLME